PPFRDGIDWRAVEPSKDSDLLFVCGPLGNGPPATELLTRFHHCRMTGVNLTMLDPLEVWNPFSLLLERDSSRAANPVLAFIAARIVVPVVGVVLIGAQPEYGESDLHQTANASIWRLVHSREMA